MSASQSLCFHSIPRGSRAQAKQHQHHRLTKEELRNLRPLLGEVDSDVVSRWLAPSPDDAKIEAILAQWRLHREMALALARNDWAASAAEINARLAKTREAIQLNRRRRSPARTAAYGILLLVVILSAIAAADQLANLGLSEQLRRVLR